MLHMHGIQDDLRTISVQDAGNHGHENEDRGKIDDRGVLDNQAGKNYLGRHVSECPGDTYANDGKKILRDYPHDQPCGYPAEQGEKECWCEYAAR